MCENVGNDVNFGVMDEKLAEKTGQPVFLRPVKKTVIRRNVDDTWPGLEFIPSSSNGVNKECEHGNGD